LEIKPLLFEGIRKGESFKRSAMILPVKRRTLEKVSNNPYTVEAQIVIPESIGKQEELKSAAQ